MMAPHTSVIIPTYNRPAVLQRLLQSLGRQTLPAEQWEVIVVHDGPPDPGYAAILQGPFPFPFRFLQPIDHQGAAAARNLGARGSQAQVLVFLDDDVCVEPEFLARLVPEHQKYDRAVLMGGFRPYSGQAMSAFRAAVVRSGVTQDGLPAIGAASGEIEFIHCVSHNLSIKRAHFMEIGMFQDPTGGAEWPNWDDIDLAYRARCLGFTFRVVGEAVGTHVDAALEDFQAFCRRAWRAGRSANYLFSKYPGLSRQLPMFQDKTPIDLRVDPLRLILRKLFRALTAWIPVLWLMDRLVGILERRAPASALLNRLYRWQNSSYIYRGYHAGLAMRRQEQARR